MCADQRERWWKRDSLDRQLPRSIQTSRRDVQPLVAGAYFVFDPRATTPLLLIFTIMGSQDERTNT